MQDMELETVLPLRKDILKNKLLLEVAHSVLSDFYSNFGKLLDTNTFCLKSIR